MRRFIIFSVLCGAVTVMDVTAFGAESETNPPEASVDAAGASQRSDLLPDYNKSIGGLKGNGLSLDDLLRIAKQNGYDAEIIGRQDDQIFRLKLTKIGKTLDGHGLLQKKWDQKDVIDLSVEKKSGGLTLGGVSRDIMVKPPIGEWINQPSNVVPAWLAPSLTSG